MPRDHWRYFGLTKHIDKPGATMSPRASIVRFAVAFARLPRRAMRSPLIAISALKAGRPGTVNHATVFEEIVRGLAEGGLVINMTMRLALPLTLWFSCCPKVQVKAPTYPELPSARFRQHARSNLPRHGSDSVRQSDRRRPAGGNYLTELCPDGPQSAVRTRSEGSRPTDRARVHRRIRSFQLRVSVGSLGRCRGEWYTGGESLE